jgi:hypothetical protein
LRDVDGFEIRQFLCISWNEHLSLELWKNAGQSNRGVDGHLKLAMAGLGHPREFDLGTPSKSRWEFIPYIEMHRMYRMHRIHRKYSMYKI